MATPDPAALRDEATRGHASLEDLRRAASGCRACDLYRNATQTVFGQGGEGAQLMLVGEQPGDREDIAGEPFVGPAGRLLDEALDAAGIDRRTVYVTNVVKHFKWRRAPSGKRRIHQKPDRAEVTACRPWLEGEISRVKPKLVVLMGATAAQAIFGSAFRVTKQRGSLLPSSLGPRALATIHPSAVLRARTSEERAEALAGFIADLRVAADTIGA
ncbi:MAG TPA: UdgX family uracil-DNA binding protein [Candidatus Limnocylindria bacterium]|jgi:DNA polymerase|nr:UdgX family uracil-DNA binding protein [Candidatus Limnocylindria bacterium]